MAHQLGDVIKPLVRLCLRVQDLQPAERLVPLLLVVREGGPREVEHIGRRAVRPGCCDRRGCAGPVGERAYTKGSCSQAGYCFFHMHGLRYVMTLLLADDHCFVGVLNPSSDSIGLLRLSTAFESCGWHAGGL